MKLLKYSFLSILLLLLIIFGGITWIVSSEAGLRFLVEQAEQWAPGEFKIDKFEGSLLDKVSFTGLSYQHEATALHVDSFLLNWESIALLDMKLHVKQLHIKHVELDLPKSEKPDKKSEPFALPDIQLPIQIALDDVQINQVIIRTPDAEPVVIDSIELRSTTSDHLSLQQLEIKSPLFNAKVVGDVGFISPHRVELALDWSAKLPEFTVVGQGRLNGSMKKLYLTHTVSEPLAIELNSSVIDVLGALKINAVLKWKEIYWPFNTQEHLVNSQQGYATLSGGLENYRFDFYTRLKGKDIPAGNWKISAQGNQDVVTITKLRTETLEGVLEATGKVRWKPKLVAQLKLNVNEITVKPFWKDWPDHLRVNSELVAELDKDDFKINHLNINIPQTGAKVSLKSEGVLAGEKTSFKNTVLNWQNLKWPLVGNTSLVNSQTGSIQAKGTPQNYQVDLNTQLVGKDIPESNWSIKGHGNLEAFQLNSLHSTLLKGAMRANGQISWKPKLVGQLQLKVNKISVKKVWKDWPNHLRINSELVAKIDQNHFKLKKLTIRIPKIGTKVSLKSEGILAGEKTSFKNTVLSWQGLKWPLVGKSSLVKSQTGSIQAKGTPQNYQVNLNTQLVGKDIPYSKWSIQGQGNLEEFQLKSLHSTLLKGVMKANGKVSWKPKLVGQLQLKVNKISVKKFWKDWPNQLRINSELVAKIDQDHFKLKKLTIRIPKIGTKVSLKSEGILAGEKTSFKNTVLNWQGLKWPLVGKASLVKSQTGSIKAKGTPQNYQVDLKTQLVGKDIPYSKWSIQGQGNLEEFQLKSLHSTLLKGAIKAKGKISWKPKLVGQLKLNVNKISVKKFWKDWPNQLRINSELVANIDKDKFQIKVFTVDIPQTAAKLSLQADAQLAGENTRFNSKLKWKGLQWPLVGKSSLVNSKTGSFQAKGTAQAYNLRLVTDINGKDIPIGHWEAVGHGNSNGLNLKSLQGNLLKGYLNLKGQLHWKPALDWKLTLKGKNINLGSQWPEVPSKLALDIRSQGNLKNGDLKTQLQIKHLQGSLRNYPLQLKTAITIDKNQYNIKHFDFKSAKNSLTANGKLGDKSRLDWRINAPNLASLLPELKGSITGKGRVTGPINLPHIIAKLEAKSLGFQENSLKTFKTDIDVNLFTQKNLRLDIVANDLSLGTNKVEQFSLTGKGSFKQHNLVAKLKLPIDSFSIAFKGGLKQSRWLGKLEQLNASTAKLGNWKLQAPSTLILSATEAKLAQSCVQRTPSSKICTQLHWQAKADSTVQVSLKKLPLNLARAFLDSNTIKSITGQINGNLKARLSPNGVIKSDNIITVSRGFVKSDLDGEQKIIRYKGGAFKLIINQKGLDANLKFGLLKRSSINGNFKLPGFSQLPLKPKQIMTGKIKATFDDLSILPTFVPAIEKSQGKVNMDVTLNGRLDNPKVKGLIAVKNAAISLPVAGLELKKMNATLRGSGNDSLKMQARVNSGKGQLKLNGKAKLLSATDWTFKLNIAGKNFEVANIPAAWVLASPDLKIKMAPGKINVTGKVSIPVAEITPPSSSSETGAVAISEDVVIVNPIEKPKSKPKEVAQKWAISSKVKIILGKKVRFEGAGFKSHFGGRLIASNQPGKVTLGNGELYIINGRYKAYGQNLKIDRGRVFFAGGAIDNPGLDIKAYRKIKRTNDTGEVIAGIHIQGTAQSPKLTLYSKPPFDQSNTLSYIILGKPIANASKSEGNTLVNALASLSLQQGDSLTKEIGQTFGLDTAGIDTEEGLDNAAMMLGKYLTPSLYISYGIGLFDGRNILRMRYELTKKLTLETETSTESGVDLRYSFER
jgi:translocation and assembly module TamB